MASGNQLRRKPQALIVAFEDVLIDATAWRRWLWKLLSRLGVHSNFVALFRVWECDFEAAIRRGEVGYWEALSHFLRAIGLSRPQAQEVELAARSQRRHVLRAPHAFPGVHRTLNEVREQQQVSMSVVRFSDEWVEDFGVTLVRTRLRPYFDHQHSWNGLPEWQSALQELELGGEEVAFVGCQAWQLIAARQAGLATIGVGMEPNDWTDCPIDELAELPRLFAA